MAAMSLCSFSASTVRNDYVWLASWRRPYRTALLLVVLFFCLNIPHRRFGRQPALPAARDLLAHRGYDSNHFRAELATRGIVPCIPSTQSRTVALPYDRVLYRQRHRIEDMFGRFKDWRRIATRYDGCAHTFFSALCIAATVTFWLP
jgi:transposase